MSKSTRKIRQIKYGQKGGLSFGQAVKMAARKARGKGKKNR